MTSPLSPSTVRGASIHAVHWLGRLAPVAYASSSLLAAALCFACDGPDAAARARYVEGSGGGGSAASDAATSDVQSPTGNVLPYPDWGALTSACGTEHVDAIARAQAQAQTDADPSKIASDAEMLAGDAGMAAESGAETEPADAGVHQETAAQEPPISSSREPSAGELGLRDLGRLVGTALAAHRLSNAAYTQAAARNFNLVTPENEMKWDSTEPTDDRFTFASGDAIVQFAVDNDMLVKGHTLVWHSQLPGWVSRLQGEDVVRAAMTDHIQQVMGHYTTAFPDVVVVWDVVNEAIDSRGGQAFFRDSVFYSELGERFIGEAFTIADAADPEALLFYNDYGIEGLGPKSDATYEMVQALVDADVPIDGVGFQMHTRGLDFGPSVADFKQNLQRFVDLGLLVSISEMDVNLCSGFDDRSDAINAQRERYRSLIEVCLEFEACHSVSVWGMGDGGSWLNQQQPCDDPSLQPWPLLFTDEFEPKPAWWGVFDALSGCSP